MKKNTNEEFIKRVKEIHGDAYDYSKVNYINAKTKVELYCKKHDISFKHTADNILSKGYGCPICRYEKSSEKMRQPLDIFLDKAKNVHGDKYDYSKVNYINNKTKVCIICPKHGEFWQMPCKHIINKQGCPCCSGNARRTTESFINDANKVHNGKYDYSEVEYDGIHKKVRIICHEKDVNGNEHGIFLQTPHDHLQGQGCPKCKGKKIWDSRGRLTVEEVKTKFREIHGDRYGYSLFTEYKNNTVKIPIICKKHGVFYISSNNHLMGKGCPKCKGNTLSEKQRLSTDEVIRRIKDVHGERYDIPNDFEYKNNITKVKLICPMHGEFYQNPFNLWRGVGCPRCNKSKLENEVSNILDKNDIEYIEQKKFPWLKNYELDFYLPQYNIAIECQGKQHFTPIEIFGGKEQFEQQVIWDNEKNKLCEEHGVKILYYTSNKLKDKNSDYKFKLLTNKIDLLNEINEYR